MESLKPLESPSLAPLTKEKELEVRTLAKAFLELSHCPHCGSTGLCAWNCNLNQNAN